MAAEQQIPGRPDPDALLKKVQKESRTRGNLTVFLGAMAGVGKTFTMLEAAHERLKEGRNIMIGWVETHRRADTEKLVAGIPAIAPIELAYRGQMIAEMDIDAILARHPEIVIVDELAHTNAPGSRHKRRVQDVEELLAEGIHIYTAVNIQHIESLNDIVAQITGVIVKETVPDSIIEQADTVQLIDIAPEDLMQRLRDGKIYIPAQAERALKNFFRQGNINALRELALRFTAQRVDKDLIEYMRQHNIEGPWPAAGRVMVGVSGSPFSAQLIRAAARLAAGLRSELLAVHVEVSGSQFPIGDKERDRIAKNLRMAEDLGAKTFSIAGENFIEEFLAIARKQNITAIVIGKPKHRSIGELLRGSIADNIIRKSGSIHVYVIHGTKERETIAPAAAVKTESGYQASAYGLSVLLVIAASLIFYELRRYLEVINLPLLYLIPVIVSAVRWGRWPSYLSALTGILAFDYLFIDPLFTFTVNDIKYLWSFVIFLFVAFLIGGRTENLKREMRQARQQEKNIRAVYEFSRDIAAVGDSATIARSLALQAGGIIDKTVVVLLPDPQDQLRQAAHFDPAAEQVRRSAPGWISDSERAVASWAYRHRQAAGRSTDTLPGGSYLYVPIAGQDKAFGVLGICLDRAALTPTQQRLINAWVRLASIAIERVKLAEQANHTEMLIEADRLRTALFSLISHELKTPLSAILGSVSTLLEGDELYSKANRMELLVNIKESSLRMERLIANLLDTARLESGMMNLKTDWCDIEDILGTTLRRMDDMIHNHPIQVELPDSLPLIRADCVLIEQVLVNLIDNAIKYSPKQEPILLRVCRREQEIEVAVMDRGSGIPPEDLERVFDKFYRVRQPMKVSGTGLGLSICKGIVEAHKGIIRAQNRAGGGTILSFTLPIPAGTQYCSAACAES